MMLLLAVVVFLFSSLNHVSTTSLLPLLFTAGILAWWFYVYLHQKKGKPVYFRIALFLAACCWYIQPGGKILSLIYLMAALFEKQVKFPEEVAFDGEEVVFNTFPRKHYAWTNFRNVVLKDGLLTIDFMNNKLIQKELESFSSIKEEAEFNTFCQKMLVNPAPGS